MLAHFLSLVLVNTYSWFGGQGYCAYDFAIIGQGSAYRNVEITLRPQFDPQNTATGRSELGDETITLESLGTSAIDAQLTAKVESDCSITGFTVIKATASVEGKQVDLLKEDEVIIEAYKPLKLDLGAAQ